MKSRTRLIIIAAVCVIAMTVIAAGTAFAQASPKERITPPRDAPQSTTITPQPMNDPSARIDRGAPAPLFELDASTGVPVKLQSLRGDWVALVFSDRLDSSPALESVTRDLRPLGVKLAVVCREKASRVRMLTQRDGFTFLVFADPIGQVAALYGLSDYHPSATVPAFLLIDRHGIVKVSVVGTSLPPADILAIARSVVVHV